MANEIFNETEQTLIDKSLSAKIKMIDTLTSGKEVSKEEKSTIRLLNEVLNGVDSSVNAFANTRLKAVSDENQAQTQSRALEILQGISRTKVPTGKSISVYMSEVEELGDDEIVMGETADGYEELELKDFVGKGIVNDKK
jgi:hypothetical protein